MSVVVCLVCSICARFWRSTVSFFGRPLIRLGVDDRLGELPSIVAASGRRWLHIRGPSGPVLLDPVVDFFFPVAWFKRGGGGPLGGGTGQ
jgi:hypothetical protein